jgi:hypothetical protein
MASAEVPIWKVGDTWRYRGTTFTSRNNRFYERVVREIEDSGRPAYEVDSPDYVTAIDKRTLRPLRHRDKETGKVTPAITYNPIWFPLNASSRYSMKGTRRPKDESAERLLEMNCRVVSYEDVTVHAGTFAAFRIDCETNDGFAEHWYAPAVKNLVKMRWMGERESFVAELWECSLVESP